MPKRVGSKQSVMLVVITMAALGGCATDGRLGGSGTASYRDEHGHVSVTFSDHDRELVRRYYRQSLPPGLAKREQLPPGIRKQFVRRGTLPPGLQLHRLPADLDRRLSPLPRGYARIRVASDVLLLDERTRLIVDLILDVNR